MNPRYVGAAVAGLVAVTIAVGVAPSSPSRVTTNTVGILSGSGTTSNPLAMSLASDGTSITGTGSSGSGFAVAGISTWRDSIFAGFYGPGTDGACVFDGSTVVAGITPAANVYTLPRDVFCTTASVSAPVHVHTAAYRLWVNATLTNNGRVDDDGADALAGGLAVGVRAAGIYAANVGGKAGGGTHGANAGAVTSAPPSYTSAALTLGGGDTGGTCGNGIAGTVAGQGGGGGGGGQTTAASACPCSSNFPGGNGGAISSSGLSGANGYESWISMISGIQEFGSTKYVGATQGGGGGGTGAGSSAEPGGYAFVAARVIAGSGAISANAGVSAAGTSDKGGGGGGSGGGIVVVFYNHNGGNTITASGGVGRAGSTCAGTGGNGADGTRWLYNLSGDGT